MAETGKTVLQWLRDPKWWAVVFLAWTLSILFYDIRPSLQATKTEHTTIESNTRELAGLLRESVHFQRVQAYSAVQDCVNHAGNRADLVRKCFATLNGEVPTR